MGEDPAMTDVSAVSPVSAVAAVAAAFERRTGPATAVGEDAERIVRACQAMAERFREGGKLLVFGTGGSVADAQHVAVEFAHPVIMGKPALPAVSLTTDMAVATGIARTQGLDGIFAAQLRLLAAPRDIALGLSADGDCAGVRNGLAAARALGLLTVALTGGRAAPEADHVLAVRSDDPLIVKEVHVTIYHVLWELVHVFHELEAVR
ncbi:Phosphoheptose isomerase 1 [Nonomuraea coxensis DSM 45129]|uniref:Phosphoheptose isomerase 1 n=1 Tax=Nonomuraea coxensis DSM 45129 TaxID=1122611 RepID=A0ABX8UDG1_9ACTN|nr:SIS domain-containing protein [Nonomuraea coxensis]QYC45829.1 Phosphoheptose isomerase 1 [Nonomuraea coxensis DSM 45129]